MSQLVVVSSSRLRYGWGIQWGRLLKGLELRLRWANVSPSVRRAVRGMLIALLFSLAILAGCYFSVWYKHPDAAAITPDRVVAFLDAVLAGIAAFVLIGAFTFIVSIRKPEEEGLAERISYLYSARHDETPGASEYLKRQVTLLGATAKRAEATYTVAEVSPDQTMVRMVANVVIDIVNMMKLDTYVQDMPLIVGGDALEGFNGDALGWVRRVTTQPMRHGHGYGQIHHHIQREVKLTNTNPIYKQNIKLEIPPGGELRYEYAFEVWQKPSDDIWFTPNRYCERVIVKIHNNTADSFKLSPCEPNDSQRKSVTIAGVHTLEGSSREYKHDIERGVPPEQRFACRIELLRVS